MTTIDSNNSHHALEQKRDETRSRLFGAIDTLDRRRRSLGEIGGQMKTVAGQMKVYAGRFAFGAGAISLAVIASLAFLALRSRAAEEPPARRSMMKDGLRRAAIGLVMFALNQLGRRTVRRFVGEYPQGRRIAVTE